MDALGFVTGETPFRIVFSGAGATLRDYGNADSSDGPVLLIIPAPIKDASIWDLAPWASVARHCGDAGIHVYLVEWKPPPEVIDAGLREYAGRFVAECLDAITEINGEIPVFGAGHSLGGTLAAIFAALHPDRFAGLVLLGSPLHFGQDVGAIDSFVAAFPHIGSVAAAAPGSIPGSMMSAGASVADPHDFRWSRLVDRIRSQGDRRALLTHLRVVRWSMQEASMARELFRSVVEELYRDDRFYRGELRMNGGTVGPANITVPLLFVVDPRCRLVPPGAMLPFMGATSSGDTTVFKYGGDTGVALQHVGMLAGKEAHRRIWPKIVDWIHARSGE